MQRLTLVLVVVAATACTSDDATNEPICGDAVCNGTETTATCATDCPATGPFCGDRVCNGNETPISCTQDCPPQACTADPVSCSGETICLNGACVAAFGRAYRIVAQSATIPQRDPNGEAWDVPGGLPDPYAVINLNAVALGMTFAAQDTLTPAWNQGTNPVNMPAGSTVRVDVWDEDIADDDLIVFCAFVPTADQLHAGSVACTGAAGTLTVGFLTQ